MDNLEIRRLFNERNRFAAHAGVEVVKLSPGAATCRMAVNLSIAYLKPATGRELTATASELSAGGRMATYSVRVTDETGGLIADVQAMGYRTKTPLEDV